MAPSLLRRRKDIDTGCYTRRFAPPCPKIVLESILLGGLIIKTTFLARDRKLGLARNHIDPIPHRPRQSGKFIYVSRVQAQLSVGRRNGGDFRRLARAAVRIAASTLF